VAKQITYAIFGEE